jgi:hypothetical protein
MINDFAEALPCTRSGANPPDPDGQLTHDGVAGERSDLSDLHPAVMAAPVRR